MNEVAIKHLFRGKNCHCVSHIPHTFVGRVWFNRYRKFLIIHNHGEIQNIRCFPNTSVRSEPTSKGFSGEVLCHDISEIMRSLSLAKLDIALVIKDGPRDGKIIFKGGNIMASICGDLKNREVLAEIQSWKAGHFTL